MNAHRPVLVTGGTGFLGRHIVERLLGEERAVTVLARNPSPELANKGVRFIQASLDNAPAMLAACEGMETVYHVAARVGVWGAYADYYKTNVLGTQALIEGCRRSGVRKLIYTSTPSVVYNGGDMAGADESLPLTQDCPSPYPLTKAIAETAVLEANSPKLQTVALRPHLIWGAGDPHLIPRVLASAEAGRLRIVGTGGNKVDMVHVRNAAEAHLLAEKALGESEPGAAAGKAYFITNDEPVALWPWINALLKRLGRKPVERRISLRNATLVGSVCEALWRMLPLKGEPPMTRFVAAELAKDHWFDISAAKRDLGYRPRVTMAQGTEELAASLQGR